MHAMPRHGTPARWPAAVPVRGAPWWLVVAAGVVLLAPGWAPSASAGVLYRCVGPAGETAYVSHTSGFRHCRKLGAWETPTARPVEVASRRTTPADLRRDAPPVLPGHPPRPVEANPAVLKVVPLGESGPIQVHKIEPPQVWQPFPVALLDRLGGQVLPKVLGVQGAPALPAPAAPAPAASAPVLQPAAVEIPLKLAADAPQPPRRGAVYRVQRKDGTVLYTNIAALADGRNAKMLFTYIVECYACDVHSKIDWNSVPLHLAAYGDDVRTAAKLSGVDVALLRAVIHAESGFNPRALSYKGAQGLMQLMPGTAFELGVGDAFDPAQNISGGARYLAMLLRNYHGDIKLAAAAYNAGASAVAKYGGVPPYAETEVYVKRVALLYQRYRKALLGQTASLAAATGSG